MAKITLDLPLRMESEANNREHWRAKHARSKSQRWVVQMAMAARRKDLTLLLARNIGGYTVTLTRIALRKLDDDNLSRSFKAIRDQIADQMGINDGSDLFTWKYAQERGTPKQYAVRIEIDAR